MPKKLRNPLTVPSLVQERLEIWGRAIRAQRVRQRIPAADLCRRMEISDATLRRIERGDPGVSAANYLTALWVVGIMNTAAPALDVAYGLTNPAARARRNPQDDDDYF